MKNKILTRKNLKDMLLRYISKNISLLELENWADEISKQGLEFDDWDDDDSLTNEIIKIIDLSDVDGLPIIKARKIVNLLDSNSPTIELIKRLYDINKK